MVQFEGNLREDDEKSLRCSALIAIG